MSANPTQAPYQFGSSSIPTLAQWNTYFNDMTALLNPERLQVVTSGAQSIPNAVWTTVGGYIVQRDSQGGFNVGTGVYTCQWGGDYDLAYTAQFAHNATGQRRARLICGLAGTVYVGEDQFVPGSNTPPAGSIDCVVQGNQPVLFGAASTVALQVYQDSGSALSLAIASFAVKWKAN